MIQVKVKDAALREAAMQDMDAFLKVFIDATKEAIGGELNAENMQQLSVSQITLLAYDILHEEVMDGGFVQLIYNGYGGFIFDNPFAKVLRDWGLRDLAKMLFSVRKLYKEFGPKIQRDCSDDEFMACSCRLQGIDFFKYISDVINKAAVLPPRTPLSKYRELLPDKWKQKNIAQE